MRLYSGQNLKIAFGLRPCIGFLALALASCTSTTSNDEIEAGIEAMKRVGLPADSLHTSEAASSWVRDRLRSTLTEEDAIRVALLNNPRVQIEFAKIGVDRSRMIQAGLLRNPILNANSKEFRAGTEFEIALTQSFMDILAMAPRIAAASEEHNAVKSEAVSEIVHLVFEVRRACVEMALANHDTRLIKSALDVAEAATHIQRELHAAGNVKDQLVTMDEVTAADVRVELADAEAHESRLREKLNVLLGAWGKDTTWTLEFEIVRPYPVGEAASFERNAIASSLDLQASRASINAAAQYAGIVGWDSALGDASVGVNHKREPTGDSGSGPLFSFAIPVFDSGGNRVGGARAAMQQRLAEYAELAIKIRSAARTLHQDLVSALARWEFLKGVTIPLRARLTRETMRDFNAMQVGVFDVLMSRREELDAERRAVDALKDATLASLNILELVAGRFDVNVVEGSTGKSTDSNNSSHRRRIAP